MARSPRNRASIGNTTPKKDADTDFKPPRSSHNALRRQQYKRAKRAQKIHAVKTAIQTADNPVAKKEAQALRGELYRTWKPRSEKKVAELERIVKAQQAEIEELKRLAQQGGAVPRLEPVSTPRRAAREAEADSSPVKIQQQLMEDLRASSSNPEEPGSVLEVEKAVQVTEGRGGDEPMDGVEEMTVAESIEKEVDYPILPSGEAEEVKQTIEGDSTKAQEAEEAQPAAADEPANILVEAKKLEVRESSADTNAGTPRNIRRSPRKRTVKRRSLAGR
ncbi:hypothetical protein N0V82_010212 [Gnomoniopsis sp. IMI 355080]|nr:hypothetical protein N0V82_010212 [Gnomoniopsis sp. IMI 355080]